MIKKYCVSTREERVLTIYGLRALFSRGVFCLILFFGGVAPLSAGSPADLVPAWVSGLPRDESVSVVVLNPAGVPVVLWGAEAPRQLGSAMKLVTSLAALETLGPNRRFRTDFFFQRDPEHSAWRLAIRGAGDVFLDWEALQDLLAEAKKDGVGRLYGPIIQDLRRFSTQNAGTAGIELSPQWVSGIVPGALTLNAGVLSVDRDSEGGWRVDPPVHLAPPKKKGCPANEESIVLRSDRAHHRFRVLWEGAGQCPETLTVRRAPLPPIDFFHWGFEDLWNHGHPLDWEDGQAPSYAPLVLSRESPPVRDWVYAMNTFSNNVVARTLLLQLAADAGEVPATAQAGAKLVEAWMHTHAWDFPEFVLENGSGLSHRETLSAAHLSQILKYALTSPYSSEFIGSLAIPGQMGTLQHRFLDLQFPTSWHLKTGTLEGVRSLAGIYFGRQGPWVLVVLSNGPRAEDSLKFHELLLKSIEVQDLLTN